MSKAVVTRYTADCGQDLREPVLIAHVSDLHERDCDDIFAMLKDAAPDIIVITGDTFERYDNRPQYDFYHRPIKRLIINMIHYANYLLNKVMPQGKKANIENVHRFLRDAVKIAPVYLSLGNHEQKLLDKDYAFLSENGIILLDNADAELNIKDFHGIIGGMSSWDFEEWLPGFLSKDGWKLLLLHHPERFEEYISGSDVALTLCGHTHGGQMRIGRKGMGFFVPGQGLFGKLAHGSFFGGRMIVSAGCSNTVAFPRLFNPRELVLIELR